MECLVDTEEVTDMALVVKLLNTVNQAGEPVWVQVE